MISRHAAHDGELGSPPAPARPYAKGKQRSRTGCRTCRSRKVKCDERPGGCLNCARLNLACPSGPDSLQPGAPAAVDDDDDAAQTQAGLRRLRTYRSCKACRGSKTRCSGQRPVCQRCRHKKIDCVYDGKQTPAWVDSVADTGARSGQSPPAADAGLQELTPASTPAERPPSTLNTPGAPEDDAGRGRADPGPGPGPLGWLLARELPDRDKIVLLVDHFFSNMHNLRCFGFVHKPSYMQQLDEQLRNAQREDALLHIICALGAKFYALQSGEQQNIPESLESLPLLAGNQWASNAKSMIFMNINKISVQHTMAVVLLHEHDLRIGDYASAFMLTGFAVRMAQALQINLEISTNVLSGDGRLSWACREARRRLMWSIYIMDSWIGSGVDELTLIQERDIKIQLPCNERNFTLQIPCVVETLPGGFLPFISPEDQSGGHVDRLDLQAQFIRLLSLRRKVLRYVKHLDKAMAPWLPESEFAALEGSLLSWYASLPSSLQFTRTAIYMRKESSQLGALLLLHWTYHQSLCDLNRIGMEELFRIRRPVVFPLEQAGFQKRTQDKCMEHAAGISLIFEEALRHGAEAFADTWLPVIAHDSTRVIVYFITRKLGHSTTKFAMYRPHASACLQANITALRRMVPMYQLAKPLYAAASNLVRKSGLEVDELAGVQLSRSIVTHDNDAPTTGELPAQFTPEYVLNPLAIYRMARRDIVDEEKNAPEHVSPPTHPAALPVDVSDTGIPQMPAPAAASVSPAAVPRQDPPVESWYDAGMDNALSIDEDLQIPDTFDNLQAYFPLMLNNFNLPAQGSFGDYGTTSVAGVASVAPATGFGETNGFSYPPPPETTIDYPIGTTHGAGFA